MRVEGLLLLVVVFGCSNADIGQGNGPIEGQVSARPWKEIIESAADPDLVVKTALDICNAQDDEGIAVLLQALQNPAVLRRLNSEAEYAVNPNALRTTQIVKALGRLPSSKAQRALIVLCKSDEFTNAYSRTVSVVWSASQVKSPSVEFLDVLDTLAVAEKVGKFGVIRAFAEMQSEVASKRIETWFNDPTTGVSKKALFSEVLVFQRHDPITVDLYARLIDAPIKDAALRNFAVQTLFDFKPLEWYKPDSPFESVVPMTLYGVGSDVLRAQLKIAEKCLGLDITETTKNSAITAKEEITKILAFRDADGPARVARLIKDLDNDSFKTREKATAELEGYGILAEVYLREALRTEISAECRRRINAILAKIKK